MPVALSSLRGAIAKTVGGLPAAFWWLWTTTLINRLGGFVATFLALYLTLERGYSASYAGLVAALYGLGGAIATLVGGVLADRIGRRPTLMAAQLATSVTTALLGFTDGRLAIAAVAFLVGLTSNASRPAMSAIMADVVPEADRVRAFSLNYWAINIGFGVSAAVAGLVAEHGYLLLFLGEAAATLFCAVLVHRRVPETRPEPSSTTGDGESNAEPRTGLGRVLLDGPFIALVGITTAISLVYQQASTTLAVSMGRSGLSPAQYGLVVGVNGLVIVLLQIPVTRLVDGWNRAVLLAVASLLTGWGFGLLVFAHSAVFYAATVVVWTVGEIILAPVAMAMATELAPAQARGRYLGVYSLSFSAAAFLGPALGGLLLDRAGADTVWLGCGAIGTLTAAAYALLVRTHSPKSDRPNATDRPAEREPAELSD